MFDGNGRLNRRRFLKTAAKIGAILMAPQVIPGTVLGKDGGLQVDLTDDIVAACLMTQGGEVKRK